MKIYRFYLSILRNTKKFSSGVDGQEDAVSVGWSGHLIKDAMDGMMEHQFL